MASSIRLLSRAHGAWKSLIHPSSRTRLLAPLTKSYSVLSLPACKTLEPDTPRLPQKSLIIRWFQTEAEYGQVADKTLETIQDRIDEIFDETSIEYELTLASGVLTLSLPPHGTWVINKQTPNQQIWWSSPLSGPKRFEYDETDRQWFATKDGINLGIAVVQEIRYFYPDVQDFEIHV